MAKIKIQSKYNFKHTQFEEIGISQTIVGETYTIKELLLRHTRGLFDDTLYKEPIYDENADFDSIDLNLAHSLDLVDKHELASAQKSKQLDLINLIKEQKESQETEKKIATTREKDDKTVTLGSEADNTNHN